MQDLKNSEVIIYQTEDGQAAINVKLHEETVWLSQIQLAGLFDKGQSTITEHIRNIYLEGELDKNSTSGNFPLVRQEGKRKITRNIEHYNLDVIISVGYRVNSKKGTQFRIWATHILKQYLVQGYSINEKRLQEQAQKYKELQQSVKLLENVIGSKPLSADEAGGLLKVITDYTYALDILDDYDHQRLQVNNTTSEEVFSITYEDAIRAILE